MHRRSEHASFLFLVTQRDLTIGERPALLGAAGAPVMAVKAV
jgi:hypothetical protein